MFSLRTNEQYSFQAQSFIRTRGLEKFSSPSISDLKQVRFGEDFGKKWWWIKMQGGVMVAWPYFGGGWSYLVGDNGRLAQWRRYLMREMGEGLVWS